MMPKTPAFRIFARRQRELNQFLWTTELTYGIVKQRGILDALPQDQYAWDAFDDVVCEAWFPNNRGEKHYRGTVAAMGQQLDQNITYVLLSVAALFVTDYEVYVENRFPDLVRWLRGKAKRRPYTIPAPVRLVRDLTHLHELKNSPPVIKPVVTLRADLMKKIRNLYAHKGLAGIPRRMDDPAIEDWQEYVARQDASLYSRAVSDGVVKDVVGRATRAVQRSGKSLGEEFFFALYTFTNVRKFVECLDEAFPG